jgi:hypothetical protein
MSVREVLEKALRIVGEPASGHKMMSSRREAMAVYKLLHEAHAALSSPPEPTLRSSGEGMDEIAITPEHALDELDLLIQEYDPEQSDWRFRKSVMMTLIARIRPATLRTAPQAPEPTRERYDCDPAAALDVSSCGQENDYRRARLAKAEPTREEIATYSCPCGIGIEPCPDQSGKLLCCNGDKK